MTVPYYLAGLFAHTGAGWAHGGWMWLWGPLMLTLWVALITAAVWLMTRAVRSREHSGVDRARDILAERFARGELTADEYQERLSWLQ
jgi:putative membrane protein